MNKEENLKNLTIEDIDKWHKDNNDQTYTSFCEEYVETVDLLSNYSKRIIKLKNENKNLQSQLSQKENKLNEIKEYIYKNSIPIDLLSNPPKHRIDFEGDINDVLKILE